MKRDVTYLYKPMGRTKGYFYGFAGILGERAKNAEQSATMRTVASIWRYELQGENAQDIAKLAGELCDKVSTSLIDLNGVAEKISAATIKASPNEWAKATA